MTGRNLDLRAIAVGALAQAPLFPVFRIGVESVGAHLFVGAAVSGAVAGSLSRTYEDEFIDGAIAATAGLFVAVYVDVLLLAFVAETSLKIAFFSTINLFGAYLFAGTPVAAIVGAFVGSVSAQARRHWWSSPLED